MRRIIAIVLGLGAGALGGCGGEPAEGTGTEPQVEATQGGEGEAEAATDGDGATPITELAWHDVPHEERGHWMHEVVMPAMQPLFQQHDPERFAEFGCRTCHGQNARDVHFEMPNGIAPLRPAEIGAMYQSEEPMKVFMAQEVLPRMAELLGEPAAEASGEGFGCLGCHGTAE